MIRSIAQKEFVSVRRDRRFAVLSALVLVLLLTATLVGRASFRALQQERQTAQGTVNEQFRNQPARHPHRVAHYGSFAFRPKSGLSLLDGGVDSFTGSAVYLEAHQQNSVNFSQAQQSGSLIRFGEMTVAFVLQLLVPLLIIFLCFGAFTQERETGTLRLLLSQGISLRQVAWGKIVGYSQAVALVVAPALGLAAVLLFTGEEFASNADLGARLALFGLSYAVYFFLVVVGSVVVSAVQSSSRSALVTLLGLWILGGIILPKATANLGATLYPTISKAQLDADVHEQAQHGIDGHDPHDQRAAALKAALLQQYGVDSEDKLPVSVAGVQLAAGEEYSAKVYQQHFAALNATFERQNRLSEWAGLLNPYQAIRPLSMGLAGSDFAHSVHFQQAAEAYRYALVQRLNGLQAGMGYGDKERRLDAHTWRKLPVFSYQAPPLGWALPRLLLPGAALLLWAGGLCGLGLGLISNSTDL
ncbi:ABC transporter permease [Hymenobacter tenuis]